MRRVLGISLAAIFAAALQGSLPVEAAEKKAKAQAKPAKAGYHSGGAMGVRGDGSVQSKPSGPNKLKAKGGHQGEHEGGQNTYTHKLPSPSKAHKNPESFGRVKTQFHWDRGN